MMEKEAKLNDEQLNKVSGGANVSPENAIHAIELAISNHDLQTAKQLYKINKSILSENQKNDLIKAFYKEFGSSIES